MNSVTSVFLVLSSLVLGCFAQGAPDCEYPPECNHPSMLNLTSCSCYCTYEQHEDPNKFFAVIPNFPIKIPMFCPHTLVWNQKECTCTHGRLPAIKYPVEDVYANAVNCKVLADIRSNGTEFKSFDGYYTETENNGIIMLEQVQGAADGKAARFEGLSLYLAVFEYNDLTSTSLFKLRVNPDDSNQTYAENQYLLSDACPGIPEAATELTYNPASGNFTLKMKTSVNNEAMCEGVASDVDGWFDISISTLNGETNWTINGTPCPVLGGTGNLYNSRCGLTVGGNPLTESNAQDFYGFIDNVKVIKHCAVEPEIVEAER